MSDLPWPNSKVLNDEEFFNRTREISNLSKLLESTGKNNAPDILVTGIKGVGKTVLLKRIKQSMDDDYLVVYMDFSFSRCYQLKKPPLRDYWSFIMKKLLKKFIQKL